MLRRALLTALAVTALAISAWGQEGEADPGAGGETLDLRLSGERVVAIVREPPGAAAALGGPAGAVLAAGGGPARRDDVLALSAGPSRDVRLELERVTARGFRLVHEVYDLRAEALVAFLPAGGARGGRGGELLAPRALYAEGAVRLLVERSGQGALLLEAERLYLDLEQEQAWVFQAEVRGEGGPQRSAAAATPVLRAEWLRVHSPRLVVAEGVTLTGCDHGVPHWALSARRVEIRRDDPEAPPPRLAEGVLQGDGGRSSDALREELQLSRDVHLEGTGLELFGAHLPFVPFLRWNTAWPLPRVRVGRSSRLGNFASLAVRTGLVEGRSETLRSRIEVDGAALVDYFERRGTGGEAGVDWRHRSDDGRLEGDGFARAYAIRDRGDVDRVGTPVPREDRYWLRGLSRERLPGDGQLDAEVSRVSDRGFLLEYFRSTAQIEKEQETYAYGRWSRDALALRALGRFRLNEFQSQVERLPEVQLDWIRQPIVVDPTLGGLYLDLAARAGRLRWRPDDDLADPSYDAWRGDVEAGLEYKASLGPLQLRGWGSARETSWSGRAGDEEDAVDRFLASAGWNLATTFWRTWDTPWGVTRHELVPEVGAYHVFHVSRDPSELLLFDPEVELLYPTDALFLRLRTRLLTDREGKRFPLLDLAVESRYFPRDRGLDVRRSWGSLFGDLRLRWGDVFGARLRLEHDVNDGRLLTLDASAAVSPWEGLRATVAYRERGGASRAVSWGLAWQLTPAWAVVFEEQYDLRARQFNFHRARVLRLFHRFGLEVSVSHDPRQDDTSVSIGLTLEPLQASSPDPFRLDRHRELYPQ